MNSISFSQRLSAPAWLALAASVTATAVIMTGCGSTANSSNNQVGKPAGAADSVSSTPYAPYINVAVGGASDMPPNLLDLYQRSHSSQLMLFGVVAKGNACEAAWLGEYGLDSAFAKAVKTGIESLPNKADDVILTFGSNSSGEYLEAKCPDAASTAAQYAKAIREYGVKSVDFDIEVMADGRPTAEAEATNNRRGQAVAILKTHPQYQDIADVKVSVTVPWEPTPAYAQDSDYSNWLNVKSVLSGLGDNGAVPDMTVAMAMNYGSWWEKEGGCVDDMYACARKSVESLRTILQSYFPNFRNDSAALGVEPMIGQNDVKPETFTLANTDQLRDYAKSAGLGRLSMWSLGRDFPCQPSWEASPTCSGIPGQTDYEFSRRFAGVSL